MELFRTLLILFLDFYADFLWCHFFRFFFDFFHETFFLEFFRFQILKMLNIHATKNSIKNGKDSNGKLQFEPKW